METGRCLTVSIPVPVVMAIVGAGMGVVHLDSALGSVKTGQANAFPRNPAPLPDCLRRTTHRELVKPVNIRNLSGPLTCLCARWRRYVAGLW